MVAVVVSVFWLAEALASFSVLFSTGRIAVCDTCGCVGVRPALSKRVCRHHFRWPSPAIDVIVTLGFVGLFVLCNHSEWTGAFRFRLWSWWWLVVMLPPPAFYNPAKYRYSQLDIHMCCGHPQHRTVWRGLAVYLANSLLNSLGQVFPVHALLLSVGHWERANYLLTYLLTCVKCAMTILTSKDTRIGQLWMRIILI